MVLVLARTQIAATNYRGEQAIGPAVVNKVWRGNGTWLGAETQSILMSVLQTCQQQTFSKAKVIYLLALLDRINEYGFAGSDHVELVDWDALI